MTSLRTVPLAELFCEDETAWLEQMSELVRQRRLTELDLDNLTEYLSDMARRDRREVKNRLGLLMGHLLLAETGLASDTFPEDCPYTVEQLLAVDVSEEEPA